MLVDHIAFLSADLARQSDALPAFCRKQAMESFPAEGTREQYVELAADSPRLLLLEPIAAGPYARALTKRGPGLHHLGATTPSLQALVPTLSAQGLRLHPISIQTLAQGVVWLCRPGLPFLIELVERIGGPEGGSCEIGLPKGVHVPDWATSLFANVHLYSAATNALEVTTRSGVVQLYPLGLV
ncbi:MAG: hypothetical protein ACO1RX_23565 [Candidatus Sericytochromatia bacterium]